MNKDAHTIDQKQIDVGDGHVLQAMLWGHAESTSPLIFLHGGPGSSARDKHRQIFDPEHHKVLFFDQRGCGGSTPFGSIEHNTTDDLVEDITKLADAFGLEKFSLVGGSWGSCLALLYAINNPDRVERLYLRGIFTGRKAEIDFVEKGGYRWFYPEVWEKFMENTPLEARKRAAEHHDELVLRGGANESKASAYALSEAESSILRLNDVRVPEDFEKFDPSGTRIMRHYISQACFLPENHILEHAEQIKVKVFIVQGRYDMVCPPVTAYELHKKLPDSRLIWTLSGHSGDDHESHSAMRALLAAHCK